MNQEMIERLRQPHPSQREIDARSASLLHSSRRYTNRQPRSTRSIRQTADWQRGNRTETAGP